MKKKTRFGRAAINLHAPKWLKKIRSVWIFIGGVTAMWLNRIGILDPDSLSVFNETVIYGASLLQVSCFLVGQEETFSPDKP